MSSLHIKTFCLFFGFSIVYASVYCVSVDLFVSMNLVSLSVCFSVSVLWAVCPCFTSYVHFALLPSTTKTARYVYDIINLTFDGVVYSYILFYLSLFLLVKTIEKVNFLRFFCMVKFSQFS